MVSLMASDLRTRCFLLAVRSWNLVIFLSTIGIITFVSICVLALWLIWEMGNSKRALDAIRSAAGAGSNAGSDQKKSRNLCACWSPKVAHEPDPINLGNAIKEYKDKESKKNAWLCPW